MAYLFDFRSNNRLYLFPRFVHLNGNIVFYYSERKIDKHMLNIAIPIDISQETDHKHNT